MMEHTLTLIYFHILMFLSNSLSLSFMSLNKTDVNFILVLKASSKLTNRLTHFLLGYKRHPGPLKYY